VESTRLLNEALTGWQETRDLAGSTYALVHLGITSLFSGDTEGAEQRLTRVEAAYQAMGDVRNTLQTRAWLGYLAGARGDPAQALASLRAGIDFCLRGRDPRLLYHCATLVLWLATDSAGPEQVAQLVGAHEALRHTTGFVRSAWIQTRSTGLVSTVRERLTPAAFEAELAEGRALTFEQTADLVLRVLETSIRTVRRTERAPGEKDPRRLLSAREQDVLRLVADGLTSKAIGKQLYLSSKTVDHHLSSVFNKLGVESRAHAVAVATREGHL
jgi:DNA-binding CsgD family transcriptional regulator